MHDRRVHDGPVRFERPTILGRGARGTVYRVHDRQLARDVALKRMHAFDPDARVRFKREFRAIDGLRHPNLVRMLELGDDGEPYLLMELVDGHDLRAHLALHGRAALLDVLPGLLDGLDHLHGHGIVHRDLKPENVLISASGEAKLCDFGLLAAVDEAPGVLAGTPLYMSPEQVRGEAPSPASDLYALGAVLFEAITGSPPFRGGRDEVLRAHLELEPPSVPSPAWAPSTGARAIARLLAKEPHARGTLDDVHDGLLGKRSRRARPSPTNDVIGRAPMLERVSHALEEPRCLVAMHGPSGIGKSTLLQAVASTRASEGALVLAARARTTERVAFNVMDAIVDGIAMELVRSRGSLVEELEPELTLAASAFPVLALTPRAMRQRDRTRIEQRLFGAAPPPRTEAFAALARILSALARARSVFFVIDDFQWADEDSLALLARLRELRAPIGIALALRADEETAAHAWVTDEAATEIPVDPLDVASLRAIAVGALGDRAPTAAELDELCARAAGRPLLARIFARAYEPGAGSVEGSLRHLIGRIEPELRHLLTLLSVSEVWVPLERLTRMLGADRATTLDRARELAGLGLVQESRAPSGQIQLGVAHDSIRAGMAEVATERELVEAHLSFVAAVEREPAPPLEVLVHHLLGAGQPGEAARHARQAAIAARERAAFGLAADMLAIAIATRDPDVAALRRQRADDLEHAGRFADAASAWRELADLGEGEPTALGLARAHALIAANRTREGLDCLDDVLRRTGESGTLGSGLSGLEAGARFFLGPLPARIDRRLSRARPVAEGLRDAKLGVLLAFLDPLVGMRFLGRARQTFLALGDAEQLAIIESFFAVLGHVASASREVPRLAARWAASAASRVEAPRTPEARGMPCFLAGLTAMRSGRWEVSKAAFAEAAAIFAHAAGTTERLMACSWRMMGDVYSQDLPAMKRHLAFFDRELRRVGDGIIVAHVELARGYAQTLEGELDRSRDTVQARVDMFGPERPNVQRAAALMYRHIPDMYGGNPRVARESFARALAAARRHRFLHTIFAAPFAAIGALLEAGALRVGDPRASHRRVERFARVVDVAPPLMAGTGSRALAYAADARGRPEEAIALLRRAEMEARAFDRRIDVAIARAQLGRRLGGEEGRALVSGAEASLRELRASPILLNEDAGSR